MKFTIKYTPVYSVTKRYNPEIRGFEWYNQKKDRWQKVTKTNRVIWGIVNWYLRAFKSTINYYEEEV